MDRCAAIAQKTSGELFRMNSAFFCYSIEVAISLYRSEVRTHLEYPVHACSPFFKKDAFCIEHVQGLATRMAEEQSWQSLSKIPSLRPLSLDRIRQCVN